MPRRWPATGPRSSTPRSRVGPFPTTVPRQKERSPAYTKRSNSVCAAAETPLASRPKGDGDGMAQWKEVYAGGSPEAEFREFQRLAQDIMLAQVKTQRAAKAHGVDRAFHAKATLALDGAELRFLDSLPPDLAAGHARPGAAYPAIVRFSNAASAAADDNAPDLRGIALRFKDSDNRHHDLLATNFPVSHARDGRQFVAFAVATAGGT